MNILFMTEKQIQAKVIEVRQHLNDQWSLHVAFRKAGVTKKAERFIRPHLEAEIKKYKSKYPCYSGVETTIV